MDHQEQIDALLERYLGLLNNYSTLHASLAPLHGNMYQAIARANFSADRGIRYGQDHYDDRMQAARRLVFDHRAAEDNNNGDEGPDGSGGEAIGTLGWTCRVVDNVGLGRSADAGVVGAEDVDAEARGSNGKYGTEGKEGKEENAKDTRQKGKPARDPVSWFGFMAPHSLREAQAQAVESVTMVVPRLAAVVAEMREVEIEIGRARKRRAKAEAAASKEANQGANQGAYQEAHQESIQSAG